MIREYQTIAEGAILQALETNQRVMFSLATGLGKTVVVTNLIRLFLHQGSRIIFIAHRQELIKQAWDTFHRHHIISGIIMAKIRPNYSLPCQIGSVQTMIRRELPEADYIFVDEAHHCMDDNSYGKIIRESFPNAKVIGVTATPYRLAGKGFTKIFDCLIESLQLAEGVKQGFLVPLRYFACTSPDLSKVHLSGGDYKEDEAVKAMELVPIVESYLEHARGKCGICFAINIQHSIKLVNQFTEAGVRAEHVDGNTSDEMRAAIFKRLHDRITQVVVNVGIATEGVDIPNIDFVQSARPTKSLSLFFQMIGRGTRVDNELIKNALSEDERKLLIACSEKPHCIVLDNAGLYKEHGLPDQVINWQRHFQGWKREKKQIEEMIEIFVAEDSSGREVRTKLPKEIEGLKLIEITHEEKKRIVNLTSIKEFDRLFALFKRLHQIAKPGFKAYFEYRDYCLKNSYLMNDDVWEYLRLKLSTKAQEDELLKLREIKMAHIKQKYFGEDADFLIDKVNEHSSKSLNEIKRFGVPEGFLRKEKEKYNLTKNNYERTRIENMA
jgi:superfamily II DNA or RNA helicase